MLIYLGTPDYSQVQTALQSNRELESALEVRMLNEIGDQMQELSEKVVGVRRRNYFSYWNSDGMVLECWNEGSPSGFSQMIEFESFFYIQRILSIEAC